MAFVLGKEKSKIQQIENQRRKIEITIQLIDHNSKDKGQQPLNQKHTESNA